MEAEAIQPGDVFAIGCRGAIWGQTFRVMARDEWVALCESQYRTNRIRPRSRVRLTVLGSLPFGMLLSMQRVATVPLSAAELQAYGPHLPMRLLRHRKLNWASFAGMDAAAAIRFAGEHGGDLTAEPKLRATEIEVQMSLRGFSSIRKLRVAAEAQGTIPAVDVLVRVAAMIDELGWEAPEGIGIHRCGCAAKGVPSYFVAGYHDLAGNTWRAESPANQGAHPEWWMQRGKAVSRGDFKTRLAKLRRDLPFAAWVEKRESGLEQYTTANCRALQRVFTTLVDELLERGETATVEAKLEVFAAAMSKLNALGDREPELIESGERDELCEWIAAIAEAAGLPEDCRGEDSERSVLAARLW